MAPICKSGEIKFLKGSLNSNLLFVFINFCVATETMTWDFRCVVEPGCDWVCLFIETAKSQ